MKPGLRINVYPSRLSDSDLEELQRLAFRSFDRAEAFSMWLVESMQAEQIRRLDRKPVEVCTIPVGWSGPDVAAALIAANALSYAAPSYAAGKFADAVMMAVVGISAARNMESV